MSHYNCGIKGTQAACTHSDDDDAGLSDDLLGQLVEDGVRVVVEGLQLLHPVVQQDVRFKALVQGAVHRWRPKLDYRVVLLVGVLNVSERESKMSHLARTILNYMLTCSTQNEQNNTRRRI